MGMNGAGFAIRIANALRIRVGWERGRTSPDGLMPRELKRQTQRELHDSG